MGLFVFRGLVDHGDMYDAFDPDKVPKPPRERLLWGLGTMLLGIGLVAFAIFKIVSGDGSSMSVRGLSFAPALIAWGAWTALRAVRPEKPAVLEESKCWECTESIEDAKTGLFCPECSRPIHTRCQQTHAKLAH